MTRSKDPFQIPKAGLEIAPVAGLASINVNGSVGAVSAGEFLGEKTLVERSKEKVIALAAESYYDMETSKIMDESL